MERWRANRPPRGGGGGGRGGQKERGGGAYGGGGGLLVDAVVVDAALAAHGDAQLAGTALRVPAQHICRKSVSFTSKFTLCKFTVASYAYRILYL